MDELSWVQKGGKAIRVLRVRCPPHEWPYGTASGSKVFSLNLPTRLATKGGVENVVTSGTIHVFLFCLSVLAMNLAGVSLVVGSQHDSAKRHVVRRTVEYLTELVRLDWRTCQEFVHQHASVSTKTCPPV